jgi:hypothetical protein
MMDICSRRFTIKSDGFGGFYVRDRNAPYHPHTVSANDVPSVIALAQMTESQFDKLMSRLVYNGWD